MAKSSAYSQLNVTCMLDGVRVLGFWDGDDAIVVEPNTDVGQMLVGADGSSIFSQSADESAKITLRLQHTSPAHRNLMQKWQRQRAAALDGFPFSVLDTRSGEGGSTDQAFIMTAPLDQKGKNAAVRVWVLACGSWKPEIPSA